MHNIFEITVRKLCGRPRTVAAVLVATTVIAALGIFWIPFEGMLETMLPEDSEALRTVLFIRDSNFGDKMAVNIEMKRENADLSALTGEMDRLAAHFEKSPLVEKAVRFPTGGGRMMEDMLFFIERSGELFRDEDMVNLPERIDRDEIRQAVRSWYGRLARLESSFSMEIMRRDPLGISPEIPARIETLSQSFGYYATIENGHLVHPDGNHGLLLLETGIPITDTVGSRKLVEFSKKAVADLPAGFSADIISGHLHSVSNEDILRSDISRTITIASIGFIVLFLGIFRDPRAVILFLLPGASVVFSLNLSALLLGRLSYLVIGFGAVLAGIAVDYGIQVYVSRRHTGDPYLAVRRILKPVMIGALTTLCVFAAFLTSSIPGYRQLGVFAVISITLSVFAAVFFLPALLKPGSVAVDNIAPKKSCTFMAKFQTLPAICFLISLLAAAALTGGLEVETSVTQLDGTEKHIIEAENRFQNLWARDAAGQAIAVVTGGSYEEAAELNDRLYSALATRMNGENFSNLAMLWPSASTRSRNLERWNRFWTEQRIEETRKKLREAGQDYGFAEDAFEPFLTAIENHGSPSPRPADNAIFAGFEERFVLQHDTGDYSFMTFFPDTEAAGAIVSEAQKNIPGAFIVSPAALGNTLSESISSEVKHVSAIALTLIILILLILTGSLRMSLAALLPAATGVLWLFAIMARAGLALDIANMIAGIVVIGLCIDYGIFMVHGWSGGPDIMRPIRKAIILSAVTTLVGAGVLIFAVHPALFSIGLTLVIGVTAGFLAAILGVPGMCVLLRVKRTGATENA